MYRELTVVPTTQTALKKDASNQHQLSGPAHMSEGATVFTQCWPVVPRMHTVCRRCVENDHADQTKMKGKRTHCMRDLVRPSREKKILYRDVGATGTEKEKVLTTPAGGVTDTSARSWVHLSSRSKPHGATKS